MIDPVFLKLGPLQIRWYGLLAVTGIFTAIMVGRWVLKKRGEKPDIISDAFTYVLLSGIFGARFWYVFADILGGDSIYIQDPSKIIKVWEGGLNILGGIIFGVAAGLIYARKKNVRFFLIADGFCPGYLLGQAIGRIGNYINQELYGPPTTLPWGLKIVEQHRIGEWRDMVQFPYETTLFHPSFAYQMIWNIVFALALIWFINKKRKTLIDGIISGATLIIIGVGRAILESGLRPDQPKFFNTPITTSMVLSILFVLLGAAIIVIKTGILNRTDSKPKPKVADGPQEVKVNKGSKHSTKSKKKK